jgi:hypothetical protein
MCGEMKRYRFTLSSADLLSGTVNDGIYTMQGSGLGGTIKRGRVSICFFQALSDWGTRCALGSVGYFLRIKSNSFPITDVQYTYDGGNTKDKIDSTIAVIDNRDGVSTGAATQFAYGNYSGTAEYQAHDFQNWNPSQGLNIQIVNSDDTAVTAADITPYLMDVVVEEYLEDRNAPGSLVSSVSNF